MGVKISIGIAQDIVIKPDDWCARLCNSIAQDSHITQESCPFLNRQIVELPHTAFGKEDRVAGQELGICNNSISRFHLGKESGVRPIQY